MKHVLIIGLGYVGLALAKHLIAKNFTLSSTCRNSKSIQICKENGILPLDLRSQKIDACDLSKYTYVVVCAAPSKGDSYEETYLALARQIAPKLKSSKIPVYYTSSSSVYGEYFGKRVDEDSPLLADSNNAKVLIETENTYLSSGKACIFRLGQIIGPDRTLLKAIHTHRKYHLGNGISPINLSHLSDIVSAFTFAIENSLLGTFNLCWNFHPLRRDLYNQLVSENKLPAFPWDKTSPSKSCKIVCSKRFTDLGFRFSDILI